MKKLIRGQGMLHIAYSAVMMAYAGVHTTFASFWAVTGIALVLISRICGTAGALLCTLAGATDVIFALQVAQIFHFGRKKTKRGASYVIILGAQVKGRRPSRALLQRIRAAAAYMNENPSCKAVACGGMGKGEQITECQCIKETLVSMGISRDRILCEDRSVSTLQNLMFTKAMIGVNRPVVIASNRFHLYRAVEIAKRVGFRQCQGLGTAPEPVLELNYYVRECLSLWYNRIRSLH